MLTDINSDALASLFKWMNHNSDECCIINDDKSISYLEFHNYLISASLELKNFGEYDTVILACNDQLKNLVYGIAALILGINIYVPGNVNFRTAFKKLTTQGQRVFLLHEQEKLQAVLPNLYIQEFSLKSQLSNTELENPHLRAGIYLSSSGTTSRSQKLIYHRPVDLNSMMRRDCIARSFNDADLHICLISVKFFTGFRRSIAALSSGGCVVFPGVKTSSKGFTKQINALRVDHFSCVTSQVNSLLHWEKSQQFRFPFLKSLLVSGSPVHSALREKIVKNLTPNLFIGYGTNEIGEVSICKPSHNCSADDSSVGFLLKGIVGEVRVDSNGLGNLFLRDIYGSDHYGNLENKQTYFSPNDIAHLEDSGELFILGRSDDVIFFEGININPIDLENKIFSVLDVKGIAAFGDVRDKRLGAPVIFVEVDLNFDFAAINRSMRKIFRRVGDVEIWACRKLPRTPSGKILKRSLKEFLRYGKAENLDPTDCSLVNPSVSTPNN